MYIPDLTERYPEGLDGVDLTASYFNEKRAASRLYRRAYRGRGRGRKERNRNARPAENYIP